MSIEAIKKMVDALKLAESRMVESGGSGWKLEAQLCANAITAGSQAIADLEKQGQADPLDMPLPCDVKVGHVTIRKGVALRTLVAHMQVLYDMAQPNQPAESRADAKSLSLELLGAITDVEQGNGFDDVCLQTIKRVYGQLSAKCAGKT